MTLFKQDRWVTLLIGVILVCFSAIILLNPEKESAGIRTVQLDKLQGNQTAAKLAPLAEAAKSALKNGETLSGGITAALHPAESFKVTPIAASLFRPETADAGAAVKAKAAPSRMAPLPAVKQAAQPLSPKPATAVKALSNNPPKVLYFSRTKLLSQEQKNEATWSYTLSQADIRQLQKIVMAEAEGEPYPGKIAVANVVLNRLRSANFPDTIKDVIYQKRQFSPVANGRLTRVTPDKESIRAVTAALSGVKEVSDDTYYFLSLKLAQDLTVHHTRKYAKTIGNHTFYK
ncbi:cell wall hydrolase [Paenibacillus sp. NFR01]|uniref:cell wall hydrolase n=1 Tax=Paenibacillus sp. NFR01 TaxID=1566279 RepID=UPI0008CAB427|nr:cell wall hydrolase [Paenibacillus sp. NFR01]SET99029.1 N-acetylmuramoyl-L-alanine amidase [Paenibacillus sp. NFR01]